MASEAPKSLSDRLEWLFANVTRPDGTPYSYQQVEEGTEQLGHRVTTTAIWKIRKGETINPGYLVLQVVARFFGVPVRFFYEDELTAAEMEKLKLAATLKGQKVEEIALRSSKLDAAGQDTILSMLRYMANAHDEDDSIPTTSPTDSVTGRTGENDEKTR